MDVVFPFPLADRDLAADLVFVPFDDALAAASQYVAGDIVTTRSGSVAKEVEPTTAADIASLAVAGQPYDRAPLDGSRYSALFADGVPVSRIRPYEEWVMTLAGTMDAAALTAIRSGAQRDVLYNATEGCLTVRSTSGSPAVQLVRVFKGEEDDTNAQVVVRWLPGVLL